MPTGSVLAGCVGMATYRQLATHIRTLMPASTKLSKVGEPQVEVFRDAALIAHNRPMARKVLAAFKTVLRHAKRGHVAAAVTITERKRHKRKLEVGVDIPTPGEVRALLDAAAAKAKAMVALAALAGLRASELRGLRWSDVHLGRKPNVTVAQTMAALGGEDAHDMARTASGRASCRSTTTVHRRCRCRPGGRC